MLSDHEGWFNDEGEMTVIGARKFLGKVQKAQQTLQDMNLSEEADEYVYWICLLEHFLKIAIERKATITWSV